jgi:hypothetical protein
MNMQVLCNDTSCRVVIIFVLEGRSVSKTSETIWQPTWRNILEDLNYYNLECIQYLKSKLVSPVLYGPAQSQNKEEKDKTFNTRAQINVFLERKISPTAKEGTRFVFLGTD